MIGTSVDVSISAENVMLLYQEKACFTVSGLQIYKLIELLFILQKTVHICISDSILEYLAREMREYSRL